MDTTPHALIFTLAAIGISEVVYLIKKRIAAQRPVCPLGGDCVTVLTSKYNKFFFIPNDILGLLFYITITLLAAFIVIGIGPVELFYAAIRLFVAMASIMSLYLTFLQWRIIKAWCFWCLMSAFTVWLMALVLLTAKLI